MSIDFFREGNELKEKTKEELIKEINDFVSKNESMLEELQKKKEKFSLKVFNDIEEFLIKELSFILAPIKDHTKIYKFMKNKEEYSIEISRCFIKYCTPNKCNTYAYCIAYKDNKWDLEGLDRGSYLYSQGDVSHYLKQYNDFNDILHKNIDIYSEIKDLECNELLIIKIKESKGSISRYDKDCKEYSNLLDFIKEIL